MKIKIGGEKKSSTFTMPICFSTTHFFQHNKLFGLSSEMVGHFLCNKSFTLDLEINAWRARSSVHLYTNLEIVRIV